MINLIHPIAEFINNYRKRLTILFILIFILLIVFLYNYATYSDLMGELIRRVLIKEEEIQPVAYWNFDNSSHYLKNALGIDHNLILPGDSRIDYDEDAKHVTYYGNKRSRLEVSNHTDLNPSIFGGFAVEFLFRVVDKREFAKDRAHFFWNEFQPHPSYALNASGRYPKTNTPSFVWRVYYTNGKSKELIIPLIGIDRADLDYYFDDRWHHMVSTYTYNNKTKKMELKVWVDGQSPEGFSTIFDFSRIEDPLNLPNKDYNNDIGNGNIRVGNFWGSDSDSPRAVVDMDQVAIYNQVLPERLIYQHYIESVIEKHSYSFLYKRLKVPAAKKMTDIKCIYYHPGFNNSDVGANSDINLKECGESITPLYQLRQFPDPRYKYNNSLNKLDYFVGNSYLVNFDGYHPARYTSNNITKLREDTILELAKNWNYYIQVSDNLGALDTDAKVKSNLFLTYHLLKLANRHPDYPVSIYSNWGENIRNNNLQQDDTNYYYLYCGEDICTKTYCKDKCISPATNLDIIEADGAEINQTLSDINEILDGKIDLLVEKGEVEPIIYEKDVLKADPKVIEDKARYPSFSSNNEEEDWLIYQAEKKKEIIDVFFNQFRENEVFSNDAILSHYNISGLSGKWPPFFFKWEAFYNFFEYSIPYLYPLNLYGWRLGGEVGSRIGWLFIPSARSYEFNIEDVQKPYWPFVAAGWHTDRTKNLRPGPWLGLLKMLVVTGAESFYPSYFHCHTHSDCDLEIDTTDKWIWQLAIPSYAQAIASKVEDDFFKDDKFGTLLEGDVVNEYSYNNIGYEFYANDWRYLVVVRKSEDNSKLLIGGVKMVGKSPDTATIENVDGISSLSFPVRTQGSVYLYNKNDQTLVQLDTWHKNRHPWYWPKKSHLFEAEVPDSMEDGCVYKWKTETDHEGTNYSNFVSYLKSVKKSDVYCLDTTDIFPKATYRFNVKRDQIGSYVMLLRARSEISAAVRERLKQKAEKIKELIEQMKQTTGRMREQLKEQIMQLRQSLKALLTENGISLGVELDESVIGNIIFDDSTAVTIIDSRIGELIYNTRVQTGSGNGVFSDINIPVGDDTEIESAPDGSIDTGEIIDGFDIDISAETEIETETSSEEEVDIREILNDMQLNLDEELLPDRNGFRYYLDSLLILRDLDEGWHEVTIQGIPGIQIDQVLFAKLPESKPEVAVTDYRIETILSPSGCPPDFSSCRKLSHKITLKNISSLPIEIESSLLKDILVQKEGEDWVSDFRNNQSVHYYRIESEEEVVIVLTDEDTLYTIDAAEINEGNGYYGGCLIDDSSAACSSADYYYIPHKTKIRLSSDVGSKEFCYRFDFYSNDVVGGIEPVKCE